MTLNYIEDQLAVRGNSWRLRSVHLLLSPRQLVTATLDVHKFTVDNLLPTPDHSHYLFSLKDFSRYTDNTFTRTELLAAQPSIHSY